MNNKTAGRGGPLGAAPLRWLAVGLVAATLAACGGGSAPQGTLRVALTDAPACGYEHVYVTVEKVRVHQSSGAGDADAGWSEIDLSTSPKRIDLLGLTNGVLEELGSTPLPAGSYQQIRLVLAENGPTAPAANALVLEGQTTEIPLNTPSGQQSGLKLQAHFDVPAGRMADLVLDFEACKSIVSTGSGKYNLKPVISVFKRLDTVIVGYVDKGMDLANTTVSAQKDGAIVRATVPNVSTGEFRIAWLPYDTYSVVITAPDRVTSVVTGVPVVESTPTTTVNEVAVPLTPASSAMASVGGAVSNNDTPSVPLTGATVRATQALTGGPTIEVASQAVNAADATYSFSLPLAGPVKVGYVASGTVVTPATALDTTVAGMYDIRATAPSYTTQVTPTAVTLGAAGSTTTKNLTLAP